MPCYPPADPLTRWAILPPARGTPTRRSEVRTMATIGFIGLGNMGGPMARNLIAAGHRVRAFDVVPAPVARAVKAGAEGATSAVDAIGGADAVITMLPAGEQVREVYLGANGLIAAAAPGTLLIDSSTIDV